MGENCIQTVQKKFRLLWESARCGGLVILDKWVKTAFKLFKKNLDFYGNLPDVVG
jgi:hypothetical protein